MAQHSNPELLPRNTETLKCVIESIRTVNNEGNSPKQEEVYHMMEDFFAPELNEAMNYLRRLPSFRNCGGMEERRQLLRQEAELVILECINGVTEEQVSDFEACIQTFRDKIREQFNSYTRQAGRESFHVDVKKNAKTNGNDRCVVVANRVDISDNVGREVVDNVLDDTTADLMEQNMGPFQSL